MPLSEDEEFELLSLERQRAGSAAPQPKQGLMSRAWDALAVPEQKSREGLKMLADYVPSPASTGNMPLDILRGTPKVVADTVAEAAPGFISRGALATAGAARMAGEVAPLAKMILRGAGRQAEELSGIAPKAAGSLEAAYKDPTLIFSKGKQAAGQFYEAAKDDLNAAKDTFRAVGTSPEGDVVMGKTANILSREYRPEVILAKAENFVRNGGKLDPSEALEVRKAVDALIRKKGNIPTELLKMRDEYDAIAKTSNNLSTADTLHQRGIQAQALRNIFPQNKYGGGSAFKVLLMDLLHKTGNVGKAASLLLSPAALGTAATGAGVIARQALGPLSSSPTLAMALSAALARRKEASDGR